MPPARTAINLESAQCADKTCVDLLLASFRQQHVGGQIAARQTTLEGLAHHVGMMAEGLATVLASAHHGIQVLIPEEGKLAEPVQPTLHHTADEIEIDHRAG